MAAAGACRAARRLPYLTGQSGYNKRLRTALPLLKRLIRELAADTDLWADPVWLVDSTPVECARSRPTVARSDLAGIAGYGYCPSHSRWFWGCSCTWSAPRPGCRSPLPQATRTPHQDGRSTPPDR